MIDHNREGGSSWRNPDGSVGGAVASTAIVHDSATIGPGAVIWPWARVHQRAMIGPGATVEAGARVGVDVHVGAAARVRVDARLDDGAHIADGAGIGPRVWIGPAARIGRDSLIAADTWVGAAACVGRDVTIGNDARIGAGVVIHDGVVVDAGAFIEPGTIVGGSSRSVDGIAPRAYREAGADMTRVHPATSAPPHEGWADAVDGFMARFARLWGSSSLAVTELARTVHRLSDLDDAALARDRAPLARHAPAAPRGRPAGRPPRRRTETGAPGCRRCGRQSGGSGSRKLPDMTETQNAAVAAETAPRIFVVQSMGIRFARDLGRKRQDQRGRWKHRVHIDGAAAPTWVDAAQIFAGAVDAKEARRRACRHRDDVAPSLTIVEALIELAGQPEPAIEAAASTEQEHADV